jgi:hypothetical protein
MERTHNFKYDIIYDGDRPKIDFDGSITNEDAFLFYELTSHLVNDLYWREKNKNDNSKITKKQLETIGITSATLSNLANVAGSILLGFKSNMDEINDILNNDDDDD